MSQSMGWADNIILAMAPLGIITIIVSAIRVGGPSWLKALVGRARENLAVVEASLMSSTSKEVCELWNGQAVVRSMGAANIWEFICLLPEGFRDDEDAKEIVPEIMSLEDAISRGYLEESRKWLSLHSRQVSLTFSDSNTRKSSHKTQKAEEGSAPNDALGLKIIIARNPGTDAPNISLNVNNQSGTGGLLWVAVLGTMLQLGVLVYSGFATYHPKLLFLKDDRPIVHYAYPCTAVGTFLLVLGMMMCAHVVDSSTEETRYRTGPGSTARMVWLQKSGTVSDQVFGSFAIIASDDRKVVLTSRRAGRESKPTGLMDRVVHAIVRGVTKLLYPFTVSQPHKRRSQSTTAVSAGQGHRAILASKTVLGVVMGLCGFIVQFIGLRGMHWSASVAQLGATLVMTAFRAWVRLGLAKPAETRRLTSEYELDWLTTALGDSNKAPWLADSDSEEIANDWSIASAASPSRLERQGWSESEMQQERPQSKAQALMGMRQSLGWLASWRGPAVWEAERLANAIGIVMNKLIGPQGDDSFTWTLGAHYAGSSDHTIQFRLKYCRGWTIDSDDIEAALSLWLYSAEEQEDEDDQLNNRKPLDLPIERDRPSLQILGPSTPSIRRDLQWWISRDAGSVMEVEVYADKAAERRGVNGTCPYKVTHLSIHSDDPIGTKSIYEESCVVDNYRIVGYGITHGSTGQNGEEWGDLDCKSSLRSDHRSEYSDASEKRRGEPYLAVKSHGHIASLYAHAMFSAFMWAVAKEATKRRGESITELRTDDTGSFNTRKSFALWNKDLSIMAHEIWNTGLWSLDEVYLSIIPPLSAEKQLPQPDEVVAITRNHAEHLGKMGHWKEASDAWCWLLKPANEFPTDGEFYRTGQHGAKDKFGLTPLHVAALADDSGLAELLIRNLAEIDAADSVGRTALHAAAMAGAETVARLLLANGADIDILDRGGQTALYVAAQEEHKALADLLIENGANKNAADDEGRTLLHSAAERGHEAAATLLLNSGAAKNAADNKGQTPLHVAAAANNATVATLLIDSGADKDAADIDGQTPLHIAATAIDSTIAELLLDNAADKEARDYEGRTPLHVASPTVGALLIKRGADEHAKDKEGREPVLTDQSRAAQDYQLQLMLLEQQNKKRMMMARRELG
jgi:ankyrin repeat protein